MEMATRSGRRFVAAVDLFGGGARRSSAADLLPYPRSQLHGAVLRVFPSPEAVERRIRVIKSEGDDGVKQGDGDGGAGWRFPGAELRRLPGRGGAPSSPRLQRRSGGGAPAIRAVLRPRHRDPEGLSCNFLFFLDPSVRTLW